ncbi:MAG: VCBS repeat-containing protein [Desulfovibrio sp.]|nr:VCBS repeat-containing protein [Desulfovibrio sp.]
MRLAIKVRALFCLACVFVLSAAICRADEKMFVIMPFSVNAPQSYSYLSKAVPGTIRSHLSQPGAIRGQAGQAKVSSKADAVKALKQSNADYAIWGVINVVGNDATVELNSVDRQGKTWSKTASGPTSQLTGTVQGLSAALGSEAMGVSVAQKPGFMANRGVKGATQQKGDIIVNETGNSQVYLNPQFRYQGAGSQDGSRMVSQRIKTNMVDMAVADFNGDGKNEIAVLGDTKLAIYVWEKGNQLKQLGETQVSSSNNNFSMRAIDLNRDGAADLVVSTFEEDSNRPYTYFFSFKGNKFTQPSKRIPYFASVLRIPPTFAPTLVGQNFDTVKLFAPGVHLLVKNGDKYALGTRLGLPSGANVYNVAWIPAGKDSPQPLLVMLTEDERIKLFQGNSMNPIHTTMERFSGSATGMEHYKSMPGLAIDKKSQLPGKYYAPMRLIAADLGNTGENVLMLNKPISTASQLFDRYRYFPQGEIHALFWDGVGLALKWKTRRIRGSVAEIDLADVTNDGITDLVVGVNTSPELGIGSRQCMIMAYPLDVTQTDPNTPADMSDFEVSPRR